MAFQDSRVQLDSAGNSAMEPYISLQSYGSHLYAFFQNKGALLKGAIASL